MMNGRTTDLSETSEVVKNLLWRWVRHLEGIGPLPITKYECGMIVVNPADVYHWTFDAEL